MFSGGKLSCIVSMRDAGAIVNVHRTVADTVITEFGIAEFKGLTGYREPQL